MFSMSFPISHCSVGKSMGEEERSSRKGMSELSSSLKSSLGSEYVPTEAVKKTVNVNNCVLSLVTFLFLHELLDTVLCCLLFELTSKGFCFWVSCDLICGGHNWKKIQLIRGFVNKLHLYLNQHFLKYFYFILFLYFIFILLNKLINPVSSTLTAHHCPVFTFFLLVNTYILSALLPPTGLKHISVFQRWCAISWGTRKGAILMWYNSLYNLTLNDFHCFKLHHTVT